MDIKIRDIIILETDKNKKGDLFNRLVCDVFHALGFDEPRFDIPKTGREIDMVLQHRTENRIALVESKAQKEIVGGADINKFVGALDVERGKYEQSGKSVVGYFIARSGFKVTALEQESERAETRKGRNEKSELVLLGPNEITRELIQGNVLCSLEKAANAVKQSASDMLLLCDNVDLIACEQGWIWVLYYSHLPRLTVTHFAFVHAAGNHLLNSIADVLINQASSQPSAFTGLSYLKAASDTTLYNKTVQDAYFKYLKNELGEIHFEGILTGREVGTVKVNLESIYVPLSFNYEKLSDDKKEIGVAKTSIEGVMRRTTRAAILAKPGGGKSTLIRYIALAYAYPEHRTKGIDGLPDCDWFPVYIRCRDLGDNATKSILDIVGTIAHRAEITKYMHSFEVLVEDALQDGRVLLLIDGLDEISNEKYRICFVNQLRTFVATYPTIQLIITSREAGFRAVAGTLASYCERYSIAGLQKNQIYLLCLKWHKALYGNSVQTEIDSNNVCDIILNDPRMTALAENPLLLTTLLFVKRRVGFLPTKKCLLYEEMIRLLLVTWNAAAHDILNREETEIQLAFVAYYMTTHGQQKISRDELEGSIIEARIALPEKLGYTTIAPSIFIDQVEERSSLMIKLGSEENEGGQWVPSYEFSQLSFQEYLTAKAIIKRWIPKSLDNGPIEVLKQHIGEENWKEIIPLAASLLDLEAKPLIEYLIELCEKDIVAINNTYLSDVVDSVILAPLCLSNCIASEVAMNQEMLEIAIILVVKNIKNIVSISVAWIANKFKIFDTIIKSVYGSKYQEVIKKTLFHDCPENYLYEFSIAWVGIWLSKNEKDPAIFEIVRLFKSMDYEDQVTGALLMMQLSLNNATHQRPEDEKYIAEEYVSEEDVRNKLMLTDIYSSVIQLLQADDNLSIYSAGWCIAWSGYNEADMIPTELVTNIIKTLANLWLRISAPCDLRRMISWSLQSVCMPSLQKETFQDICGLSNAIEDNYRNPKNDCDKLTAIHLAILTGYWTKEEATKRLIMGSNKNNVNKYENSRFLKESGIDYLREKSEAGE